MDINFRPGKPEVQFEIKTSRASELGVTPTSIGFEMRNLIEGTDVAKYRTGGVEYDIRTRLDESQRVVKDNFSQ